jgi:peptidyl-prolyl cis-trans isomerase D
MLRIIREGQRWLVGIIVFGVGIVFVFFLGLGNPSGGRPGGTLVSVGDVDYGYREFQRARLRRENQIREQLGDQFDARRFESQIDDLTVRELVDQALLASAAEEVGLRVSKREVERILANDPGFRDSDGRFDPAVVADFLEREYGSERAFLREQRVAMLSIKMIRLLLQAPSVSEGEAREALERELEEIRIAYVALDTTADADVPIEDAAVAEALEARSAEIAALYEERRDEFEQPERVRARHLLVRADPADEAGLETARSRARDLLARIEGGDAFEDVARESTDDEATRAGGGDLGFFARGQMVPEFEEAAFSAEVGVPVGPVQSPFGIHIIQVEERREAQSRGLDEVREELAHDLLREDAGRLAAEQRANDLASAIADDGQGLEDAARALDLTLERSGWLKRRPDGYVPGLGSAPDLLAAAFGMEVGVASPRQFRSGRKIALVEVLERREADADEIESRVSETQERLDGERRGQRLDAWVNAKRDEMRDADLIYVDLSSLQ